MPPVARLAAADRSVLDYLRADWERLFHLTTVPQALATLDLDDDPTRRWRLAYHLADQSASHRQSQTAAAPPTQSAPYPAVGRWGLPTLVLREDEKLLGRYLTARGVAGEADLAEAAAAAGTTPSLALEALDALQRAGLLAGKPSGARLHWQFVPEWPRRLGPLAFTWHTVTPPSGRAFGVP